jgi:hypothetical protein
MKPSAISVFLALLTVASGCGGTLYQPRRGVTLDPADEITDDEIRAAFGARPQLRRPMRLAYFAFDDARAAELERTLSELPGIEATYRIPALLTTGRRRYDESLPGDPQPLSLRQLRLIAARAHCELLVVVDYGYKIDRNPNGLVVFSALLLPALFVPFVDAEIDSYMDAYLIDVRNGYMYGQLTSQEKGKQQWMTVWSTAEQRIVDAHWQQLLRGTRETIARVISDADETDPAADKVRAQ